MSEVGLRLRQRSVLKEKVTNDVFTRPQLLIHSTEICRLLKTKLDNPANHVVVTRDPGGVIEYFEVRISDDSNDSSG